MAEPGKGTGDGHVPDGALFFELSEQPMAIVSAEGHWLEANPAFARMSGWGQEELRGQPVSRLVHADDRESIERILRGGRQGEVDFHLLTADGTFEGGRWRFTAAPASSVLLATKLSSARDGEATGLQSRRIADEIEHRIRNHLAVVRSIIRRTAQSTSNPETFAHLQGRIDAYARLQEGLRFAGDEGVVDLSLLIEDELLAQSMREGDQLTIEGPDIALSAKAAEAIALAVHELAMNAVKFGGFCVEGAAVDVRWSVEQGDGDSLLLFSWTETGVQRGDEPVRGHGFGMETLLQSLPYDLGAETRVEWKPGGVEFTMSVPLDRVAAPSGSMAP